MASGSPAVITRFNPITGRNVRISGGFNPKGGNARPKTQAQQRQIRNQSAYDLERQRNRNRY